MDGFARIVAVHALEVVAQVAELVQNALVAGARPLQLVRDRARSVGGYRE